MEGLAVMADRTQMDVVSDKGDQLGPVGLSTDILDHLGDARVSSPGDGHDVSEGYPIRCPDCQGHRAVPCSKGSCHLVKATKDQVKPWICW